MDGLVEWTQQRTWVDVVESVFFVMCVVGQHFNSAQNKVGFYYWGVGNIAAIALNVAIGRWLSALLYLYFLLQCFRGVAKWSELAATQATSSPDAGRDNRALSASA